MRNYFFLLLLSSIAIQAYGQSTSQKIGYADWDYIFSEMPEYKQIENELKTHGEQLENQLKTKYQDYDVKLKAYQAGASKMIDVVKNNKELELTQLQENIQKFQQDAQFSIQQKQEELMKPVFSKVGDAISKVAKDEGYTFVFNPQLVGGGDILLYGDEKYDISGLVLKKMGITPKNSNKQ